MKAEINANGVLTVRAETGTEAYALRLWMANFQKGDVPESHPSTPESLVMVDWNIAAEGAPK